jgi:hypothetical protein
VKPFLWAKQMGKKPKEYQEIFNKTGGKCYFCGVELNRLRFDIDHDIPKSKGGSDDIDNLNPSCKPCNLSKGAISIEEYRKQLKVRCLNHLNKTVHYLNSAINSADVSLYNKAHRQISSAWKTIESLEISFYGDNHHG